MKNCRDAIAVAASSFLPPASALGDWRCVVTCELRWERVPSCTRAVSIYIDPFRVDRDRGAYRNRLGTRNWIEAREGRWDRLWIVTCDDGRGGIPARFGHGPRAWSSSEPGGPGAGDTSSIECFVLVFKILSLYLFRRISIKIKQIIHILATGYRRRLRLAYKNNERYSSTTHYNATEYKIN